MRPFLIMLFFTMVILKSVAQDTVKIDFKNKTVSVPPKNWLREKQFVQVKISNLPANLYKVSINKTDSFVNIGTPPALFGVLSFGDGFNSLLGGLTSYTVNTTPSQVSTKSLTEKGRSPASTDFFKERLKKVNIISPCYTSEAADINESIKEMRNDIFEFHYSFRDQVIQPAKNLLFAVESGSLSDSADFYKKAEIILAARLAKDKELEKKYVSYYDDILKIKNYDLVTSCAALKAGDSMLTVYKRSFDIFLNNFDTSFNQVLVAKILKILTAPKPANEFISLPYRLDGDITKLTIDISGTDVTKTPQSYSTTIELNKHPNRLWAFTTGVFVSGLRNDEFSIITHVQPNAGNPGKFDTLNYSISKENNNGVSAGIDALMHLGGYFGNISDLGYFITFGPGLTLEKNPQIRIMIGTGLLFGRNNKLAFSFGFAGGSIKKLSRNYNMNDTYNPAPSDITRDQFKGSWFASLGYALFGK